MEFDVSGLPQPPPLALIFFLPTLLSGSLNPKQRDLMEPSHLELDLSRSLFLCVMSGSGSLHLFLSAAGESFYDDWGRHWSMSIRLFCFFKICVFGARVIRCWETRVITQTRTITVTCRYLSLWPIIVLYIQYTHFSNNEIKSYTLLSNLFWWKGIINGLQC